MNLKKVVIWIVSILVIAIAGYFGLEKWVEYKLKKLLQSNETYLYSLYFEGVDVKLFDGSASLTKFKVSPNRSIVDQLIENKTNPEIIFQLKVKSVNLNKLSYFQLLNSELQIGELTISKPEVTLELLPKPDEKPPEDGNKKDYSSLFSFKSLLIKNFAIEEASASLHHYQTKSSKSRQIGSMDSFNMIAGQIQYNPEGSIQNRLSTEGIIIEASEVVFPNYEEKQIRLSRLKFDFNERKIQLKSGSVQHLESIEAFQRQTQFRKMWFRFQFSDLTIDEIDYESALYQNWLAEKLSVDSLNIQLFNNPRLPFPPDRKFPFFQSALKSIQNPIKIDSVLINNSALTYQIPGLKGEPRSQLEFEQINGYLKNVTNSLPTSGKTIFEVSCLPNNTGWLHSTWTFDLSSTEDDFFIAANATDLDLSKFNQLIEPQTRVHINSGNIPYLKLRMDGNKYQNHVKMNYEFRDADIEVFKYDQETGQKKKRKIASFLANLVIDNPLKDEYKFETKSTVNRPSETTFFKFIWLGILDGFKEGAFNNRYEKKEKP
ncbi:DUF748 domain-containing protein [Salibacter halophilus]|uniref:DUF748 domain-containing protein n=1 Tax=Salibacter halophilus TaxID=1803916 RepID=A0A6N6M693_9FLAO|nr:DUF748 domain-containing protein [Salibacter halophilus]KAB1063922.1 DUF748 domain-containing protein [Salibacter halophilus]